ncbi:hypothetical protein THZB04_10768 [Vibrio owensii]|nr:hypothetical protein THZB04_10768 [Vibrio owensii]
MGGITSKLLKIKANKTSVSFSVDGLDKFASLRKTRYDEISDSALYCGII